MNGPESPVSIGPRLGRSYDANQGFGYGRTSTRFHAPRAKGSNFPYAAPVDDNSEIPQEDEDIVKKVVNKMRGGPDHRDHLSSRSADHFAFIGGNRRVGIANEIATATGMVPFPRMYKDRIQVGGGVNSPMAFTPGSALQTGTKLGWSQAPVPPADANDEVSFSELEAGEDLSILRLRKVISNILSQERENE
jgi:hypothetical protein